MADIRFGLQPDWNSVMWQINHRFDVKGCDTVRVTLRESHGHELNPQPFFLDFFFTKEERDTMSDFKSYVIGTITKSEHPRDLNGIFYNMYDITGV